MAKNKWHLTHDALYDTVESITRTNIGFFFARFRMTYYYWAEGYANEESETEADHHKRGAKKICNDEHSTERESEKKETVYKQIK